MRRGSQRQIGALAVLGMLALLARARRGPTMTPIARLTLDELRELARKHGFPDVDTAAAVAMAESHGNPRATNVHGPVPPSPALPHGGLPEASFGLWQINILAHPEYRSRIHLLLTPDVNARAAFAISHGGTNWHPWSTFNKPISDPDSYLHWMPGNTPASEPAA